MFPSDCLYRPRPDLRCRRPVYLERSAGQWDFSAYTVYLPPATEKPIRSLPPSLTLYWTDRPYISPTVHPDVITWTTLEISGRLTDWLIQRRITTVQPTGNGRRSSVDCLVLTTLRAWRNVNKCQVQMLEQSSRDREREVPYL